jgi:hypothetical protein
MLSAVHAIRYSSDGVVRLMLRLVSDRGLTGADGAVRLRGAALRFQPVSCAYCAVNGLAVTQENTERLEGPFKWDMHERTLRGALYGIEVPLGRDGAFVDTFNWMRQTHTFDLRPELASDVVLTCAPPPLPHSNGPAQTDVCSRQPPTETDSARYAGT